MINQETEEKTKSDLEPVVEKNGSNEKRIWKFDDNIKGQTFRIEW